MVIVEQFYFVDCNFVCSVGATFSGLSWLKYLGAHFCNILLVNK